MLKEVRKGEGIDPIKIKNFLFENELIEHLNEDIQIKQFSNGYSNLTYLLQIADREFVLRRPPSGAIKRGHDMGREYKVLSNLSPHFTKAPKTFAYTEDIEIIGAPFYLMEKVRGVILTNKEVESRNVTSEEFKTISESWLNTFVEFHQLNPAEVGLSDLGKPDGYISRQVNNWGKQYLRAATKDIPAAKFVMKWMDANQPLEYNHSLIHNDFKYDNIVFSEESWENVNAILDWEMCTLGDPLMDLGTSLGYWTMASDGPALAQGLPSPTIHEGNPSRTELVESYSSKSGLKIDNLVFYYVYGLFKIAVIAQQIFYRYDKGLTTNEKFATLDQSCEFLCFMAQQAIQKKRIDNLF